MCEAVERFQVAIDFNRSEKPYGIRAMQNWVGKRLTEHTQSHEEAFPVYKLLQWPIEKPPALVTIDDRAITVTGTWPSLDAIAAVQSWNTKPPESRAANANRLTPSFGVRMSGGRSTGRWGLICA